MNVLVLAQYFPPDMGGGSTRVSNVVNGLLKKGCNITVVAAFPHYPHGNVPKQYKGKAIVSERFGNAKVYRVWIPALPHSSTMKRLTLHFCFIISSLFALPFVGSTDVIWGANPNLFCFLPCAVYGFFKKVPIVRNVDDLWPEVFYELGYVKSKIGSKALDFMAWLSYAVPAAITPISVGYKRNIIRKYNISSKKIDVVEVGVGSIDTAKRFNYIKPSSDLFIVMYSGVLGLGYDFTIVLEAAKLLIENQKIVFKIRGVGEQAPKIKKDIERLGLRNVILDTRFLSKEELSSMLRSADVFLLPMAAFSFVDLGLPTKLFEYQSYGKPILCVSNGEPARFVKETNSGLVIKPHDYETLAKSVLFLKDNAEVAKNLGSSGAKHVENYLLPEKIGAEMKAIFDHLLEQERHN